MAIIEASGINALFDRLHEVFAKPRAQAITALIMVFGAAVFLINSVIVSRPSPTATSSAFDRPAEQGKIDLSYLYAKYSRCLNYYPEAVAVHCLKGDIQDYERNNRSVSALENNEKFEKPTSTPPSERLRTDDLSARKKDANHQTSRDTWVAQNDDVAVFFYRDDGRMRSYSGTSPPSYGEYPGLHRDRSR